MSKRPLAIALVALAGAVAAAILGGDKLLQPWAVRQIDAALSQPPFTKVSHGAVTYSPWSGHLDVADLAVELSGQNLRSFAAARIAIDGLTPMKLARLGSDSVKIPAMSAQNAIWLSDDGAQFLRTETEELHVAGVVPAEWRRAYGPASDGGDATPAALFDEMTVSKLSVVNDDTKATASALNLRLIDVKVRPGTLATGAWMDRWQTVLGGLSLGRLDVSEIRASDPANGGKRLGIGNVSIEKLAPGTVGSLQIDTFAFSSISGTLKAAVLELHDAAYQTSGKIPQYFVRQMHAADFQAGVKPGAEVSIKDLMLTMDGAIGKASAAVAKVKSITIPATALPLLRDLDYNELVVDYESTVTHDDARQLAETKALLTAAHAGTLGLFVRLSNYPANAFAADTGTLTAGLLAAQLDRFELRYDDDSLVERLLKMGAAQTRSDVDAERERNIAMLQERRAAIADKPALAANYDAVIAFLRNPRMITVTLAPPQPLPLKDIIGLFSAAPESVAERLGLSVQ